MKKIKDIIRLLSIVLLSGASFFVAVIIFIFTSQNVAETENSTGNMQYILDTYLSSISLDGIPFSLRQIAHIVEFFCLGCVIALLILVLIKDHYKALYVAIIICSIYSLLDQARRFFVPGREFDIRDLILDAFGYLMAISLVNIIYWSFLIILTFVNKESLGCGLNSIYLQIKKLFLIAIFMMVVAISGIGIYGGSIIHIRKEEENARILELERQQRVREELSGASPYQLLAERVDLNVLIVGDSIGAGSGGNNNNKPWSVLLDEKLQESYGITCNFVNKAAEGNDSYANYVQIMNLDDNIDYDLAIICCGIHDHSEEFSAYYESIIRAIQAKYTECSIILVVEDLENGYTNISDTIKELGNFYNLQIADVIAEFNKSGKTFKELVTENGIPTGDGYQLYCSAIKKVIDQCVENKQTYGGKVESKYNEAAFDYESYRYIPVEEFTRVSDVIYELTLNESSVLLGVEYSYIPGDNKMDIYLDDQYFSSITQEFEYDFVQNHTLLVGDICSINDRIQIVFGSKEEADTFRGIALNNVEGVD